MEKIVLGPEARAGRTQVRALERKMNKAMGKEVKRGGNVRTAKKRGSKGSTNVQTITEQSQRGPGESQEGSIPAQRS